MRLRQKDLAKYGKFIKAKACTPEVRAGKLRERDGPARRIVFNVGKGGSTRVVLGF